MTQTEIINHISIALQKMGVLITSIEPKDVYNMTTFSVSTPEANLIIGKDGNNLKAFNFVMNQILSNIAGEKIHINIDVNGYREKELTDLRMLAKKTADEVRKTKKPVSLRPMSSFERMVIHSMFSTDLQIETASEGDGEERRIVIKYRII